MMGICILSKTDNYWSPDYLGVRGIMAVMAKHRIKKLTQYLHINNNATAVTRVSLDTIKHLYPEVPPLSIDKVMVAFKGRYFMKQYMPANTCQPIHASQYMQVNTCQPIHASQYIPANTYQPIHASQYMPANTCQPSQ